MKDRPIRGTVNAMNLQEYKQKLYQRKIGTESDCQKWVNNKVENIGTQVPVWQVSVWIIHQGIGIVTLGQRLYVWKFIFAGAILKDFQWIANIKNCDILPKNSEIFVACFCFS